jgi:outer membrane protein assembly factor BamB
MGFQGEVEYLTALDERRGERRWATPIGTTKGRIDHPSMRWLFQRTPTVDHDRVYAFSGDGLLVCLDVSDGRVLWRKSHIGDLGGRALAWGLCDFPLVDGERVVTVVDGDAPTLTALNKRTGQVLWQTATPASDNRSAWSSQCAATIVTEAAGVRQFVVFQRSGASGFRAEDGKLLWHHEGFVENDFRVPRTPLLLGDSVILLSSWGEGLVRLNLARGASGVDATLQYTDTKITQLLTQDSAVQVGGFVYALTDSRKLACVDASSGKVVWIKARLPWKGNSSFVYVDGCLVVHGSDGSVRLLTVSPEGMTERSAFKIPDRYDGSGATIPVIADGRLFLRDEGRLRCYELREGRAGPPSPGRILLDPPAVPVVPPSAEPGRAVFVPTPSQGVTGMLRLARVTKDDVLYDLGSGDGRIVIAAARDYGARAVGFEIEPDLVRISKANLARAGVAARASIEQKDLFTVDLSAASVIAVYLPESLLEKLKPEFERLKPGSRIVSHQFRIPGAVPDTMVEVDTPEDGLTHRIYLWTTPLRKEGK